MDVAMRDTSTVTFFSLAKYFLSPANLIEIIAEPDFNPVTLPLASTVTISGLLLE